ncbi:HAD family hydrolase [Streptomyces anulatus]|uniref:HAD family hydrolase n=1 Tax=Streptomyces anulatus TaxID=1892 RepID=UPI00366799C5
MNSTLGLLGEHSIDRDAYQALHCVPIPDFYARVLGRSLTDDEWATAEGEFMRFLSQRPVRLRNGAKALLAHLRDSGYSQSLLSLLPHTRLLAETSESGVTHLFDRIDGRRAPGTTKAQALVTHLEAMGRPHDGHHEVLLIGDTRDDALAARTVGAHVVLVTGGLENAASLHQGGAAVADGLDQAVALGLRLVPHGTRGTAITAKSSTRPPFQAQARRSIAEGPADGRIETRARRLPAARALRRRPAGRATAQHQPGPGTFHARSHPSHSVQPVTPGPADEHLRTDLAKDRWRTMTAVASQSRRPLGSPNRHMRQGLSRDFRIPDRTTDSPIPSVPPADLDLQVTTTCPRGLNPRE